MKDTASAAPPPASDASLQLMGNLMGARRFECIMGTRMAAQRTSSRCCGSGRPAPCSIATAKVNTSSRTAKRGRRNDAPKQKHPIQCCRAPSVQRSIPRSTAALATKASLLSRACDSQPRCPSSSPPRRTPWDALSSRLPAFRGRRSRSHAATKRLWPTDSGGPPASRKAAEALRR